MINEIVKKIDKEIKELRRIGRELDTEQSIENARLITQGMEYAKQIILAEQKKPLTKGDVIRESNESLAGAIYTVLNGQDCDSNCPAYKVCSENYAENCKASLIKYFNQPQEDTNE